MLAMVMMVPVSHQWGFGAWLRRGGVLTGQGENEAGGVHCSSRHGEREECCVVVEKEKRGW
jgi:hypothetical protein